MSRESILGGIRRGLRRGPLPSDQAMALQARLAAHPRQPIPARSRVARPEQVALFVRNLEKEYGTIARVPDAEAAVAALARYLASQNLPTAFAASPHPEIQALPWHTQPMLSRREGRAVASDLVSLQHGFAGIAETGTLMLPGGPQRPTTLNLLSDTAIVLLRASRIVGAYEEAFDLLRGELLDAEGRLPRNVMLVTGPSRSADIESVLELGAHGPRQLHVILLDDDPAALG